MAYHGWTRVVYVALELTGGLLAPGIARAQLVEGGDIAWEAEWTAMAGLLGASPATADQDANQVYNAWEPTLAEQVVSQPGVAGHLASHVAAFNTTMTTLQVENAALATDFWQVCALAILRGRFPTFSVSSKDSGHLYEMIEIMYETIEYAPTRGLGGIA